MSKAKTAATLVIAACLVIAALAPASALAELGFTPINGNPEAVATVPAFPGDTAVYAGTCDLRSASTSNGGVGTAPALRRDCIDTGTFASNPGNGTDPWAKNQKQSVTVAGGASGGSFTLSFGSTAPTTATINFGASAAAVKSALETIGGIGANNVEVTGSVGSSYLVEFVGALGSAEQAPMTANASGLTPSGTVGIFIEEKAGSPPKWRLDQIIQAGAHPDGTATFWFRKSSTLPNIPDEFVKDVIVRLPPGVSGDPTAVSTCSAVESQFVPPTCSASAQAGVATLALIGLVKGVNGESAGTFPVYNSEARDSVTAEFTIADVSGLFNVPVTFRGRTNGDYGVDTLALKLPATRPVVGQSFTFWGVPWAPEHDLWRLDGTVLAGFSGSSQQFIPIPNTGLEAAQRTPYQPSWGPIKPFFTNPTRCQPSPLSVGYNLDSWIHPGKTLADGSPDFEDPNWKVLDSETPLLTGCDKLNFDPSIALHPTVNVADSPSGLDITLKTPQNDEAKDETTGEPLTPPAEGASKAEIKEYAEEATSYWSEPDYGVATDGLATAHLKDTVVHLPTGTSFNPAAADGLQGCTTKEIGMTNAGPPVTFNNDKVTCPESSTIGTLKVDTPLLPAPLKGQVYVAPQNDNPFPGSLTAIYLVAQDEERGLSVKLAGKIDLDPATGQISSTFVDNPQVPIDDFELHFETGPRAPLNTPAICGHFENAADIIPWSFPDSGPQPTTHDPFDISAMPNGLPCVERPQDRTFTPGFEAGTTTTGAGSFTNFVLNVTRRDGEQEVSGIALDMPPGLTGSLKGISYCTDAEMAAARAESGLAETNSPSCPAASYLGRVDTAAGAGPSPLHTPGKLYLAGPYDPDGAGPKPTAPISVVTIVPAIAGGTPGNPAFDLGNVVIRTGINLDPESAQVKIESTKVPYIVGGVPLRVRKIAVDLDRPNFMINPTNCDPFTVGGQIGGAADPLNPDDDIAATVSNGFQVGACESLAFKPNLSLRLFGGTNRNDYQRLRATVTYPPGPGYANISRAAVTLPHSEFLAQNHIRTVCTRPQFAANQCPQGSIYGHATAISPLLDSPISGNVYLRSSSNLLPDLVIALRGPASQPIEVDLVGRTDSVHGGIRNTFDIVPDAPVTKFTLELQGGKKSLIVNSRNLCAGTQRATVRFSAQNGRTRNFRPKVANDCTKQNHKRHKKH
jgi:hypothetical protein